MIIYNRLYKSYMTFTLAESSLQLSHLLLTRTSPLAGNRVIQGELDSSIVLHTNLTRHLPLQNQPFSYHTFWPGQGLPSLIIATSQSTQWHFTQPQPAEVYAIDPASARVSGPVRWTDSGPANQIYRRSNSSAKCSKTAALTTAKWGRMSVLLESSFYFLFPVELKPWME